MRPLLFWMILTVSLLPAGRSTRAQTAKDFRSKYGLPTEVFQINPGLSLTAKYTDKGLACEVDILQQDVPGLKARHDPGAEVQKIVDQLVPEAKRGRSLGPGSSEIGGCYGNGREDYELVWMGKNWIDCGIRSHSVRIEWKERRCTGTPALVVSRDIELSVYFTNPKLPEWANTCGAGEFVKRRVPPTKKLADAALRLLFAGPTVAEQAKGMESPGPLGKYYRGVSVKDGVAVVNFRPGAEKYLHVLGPACKQEQVLTPIVKTLKRFSTIKSVDYAINGKIIEEWDAFMQRERELQIAGDRSSRYRLQGLARSAAATPHNS